MIALLCGGYVAAAGMRFSLAVEPEAYSASMTLLWLATGALMASPLWLPASVPARLPRVLRTARILGAAGAFVLVAVFGAIALNNIGRALSGRGADLATLAQALVLSAACVLGIVLLLWRTRGGAHDGTRRAALGET